ncbi:MAG: phosphatase PAP2 family protein [bacterium]|nr:phosphatase PAP2 family protein [bacterium]
MPDIKIFFFLNNLAEQSPVFDWLVIFFAAYLQYILIALFLLFLAKVHSLQEKLHIFWVTAISVIISRLIITEFIRFLYHRPRPFLVYQAHQLMAENAYSFPSGHATFFFAFSTAIYCYNKRWGAWLYAASILMGLARVIAGVHYPSDILGGALIGIIIGYAVFRIAKTINKSPHLPAGY